MSELINVIFKKGVLFDINIGKWSAQHKMTPEDLLMDKVNDEAMHLGFKRLMPKKAVYPIVHLEGQIRSHVEKVSVPFPIAGAVFVNYKTLKYLIKRLKKYQDEFKEAADELVSHYEEYKETQLKLLDDEAEKIANSRRKNPNDPNERHRLSEWLKAQKALNRSLYPRKEDLPGKFYVSWRMFKVNPLEGSGTEMTDVDAEDLAMQQEVFQKDMEKWAKEQAAKVHQVLGEAAQRAKDMLEKQGKLNPKNLKPFFDALETFKSVDFSGSHFQKAVEDIEKKYLMAGADGVVNYSAIADSVNSNKDAFTQLLHSIGKLAAEDVAKNAAFEALANSDFKRVIDL